jgi:hypothetical protein
MPAKLVAWTGMVSVLHVVSLSSVLTIEAVLPPVPTLRAKHSDVEGHATFVTDPFPEGGVWAAQVVPPSVVAAIEPLLLSALEPTA